MKRRLALLKQQEADFAAEGAQELVSEHQTLYGRASALMTSPRLKAFTTEGESEKKKQAYDFVNHLLTLLIWIDDPLPKSV